MTCNVGDLLRGISINIKTPLCVEIVRRNIHNCVTHKAVVPVEYIKTDYDGSGVAIRINESDIVFKEHY